MTDSNSIIVGVNLLVIEDSSPIHEKVSMFFKNTLQNFTLSNEIGQLFLSRNLISENDSVEKVCADKQIWNWLHNKSTCSLSKDWRTSTFGKPFEVSDADMYFLCRGDQNMHKFIVSKFPNMSATQTHQFKLTRNRFYRSIDRAITTLIEGFPLRGIFYL
jgi:hypothetical protein